HQEGVKHEGAHDAQHQQHAEDRPLRNQKRIADQDRTEEPVVKQVIHVKAPLAQTSIPVLAELSIEVVRKVMKHDHHVRHPKPMQVAGGEITEECDTDRPDRSEKREVISLEPTRHTRQDKFRKLALKRHQESGVRLPGPREWLLTVNPRRPIAEVMFRQFARVYFSLHLIHLKIRNPASRIRAIAEPYSRQVIAGI